MISTKSLKKHQFSFILGVLYQRFYAPPNMTPGGNKQNIMLIFHADDYGLSYNVSNDILDLVQKGMLDGISIIPNMSCFKPCMKMLHDNTSEHVRRIKISVHLNLMEGHCCASSSEVPLLVDDNGFFKLSWFFLFMISYHPFLRRRYQKQLSIELNAQIKCFLEQMPTNYRLSIDSHQHTHFIPVVWDALYDVVKTNHYNCEFIRIPVEPITPYLRIPALYRSYGLLAFPKNIILHFCAIHARRRSIIPFNNRFSLWGIIMGCMMDSRRVLMLLPYFQKYGQSPDTLCLLFHPGTLLQSELSPEYNNPGFRTVECSTYRRMEYLAVRHLRERLLASAKNENLYAPGDE